MNQLNIWAHTLKNWSWGSEKSEQLCADYLISEGYGEVRPQAPRGGSDNGIDILFRTPAGARGGAGCYFPAQPGHPSELKQKFNSDLEKARKHKLSLFIFMTGQQITVPARDSLGAVADLTVMFVDYDSLIPREQQLSKYAGNSGTNLLSQSALNNADYQFVYDVVQRCFFFDILPSLDFAPRRFGEAIGLYEPLFEYFNVGRPAPSDVVLDKHLQAWMSAWEAIVERMFRWDEEEAAYIPDDGRQWRYSGEQGTSGGQADLKEMGRLVAIFRQQHVNLTIYLREKYPDALRNPPRLE